jgi:cytochrome c553
VLRSSSLAILLAGAVIATAAALPERAPVPDPDLYESAGCSTCHGPTAAGAFGPTLAGTGLSFDDFLGQLRSPRGMMPPVATGLVSDEQARSLFDYVAGLEEPEGGPVPGTGCPGGQHGRGHHGAGAGNCPHHQGTAAGHGQGQGRGRGGACRHGACSGRGDTAG